MTPEPGNPQDLRNHYLIGSVGNVDPFLPKTGGGGHIHIDVDSIKLLGHGEQISASGLPRFDSSLETNEDLHGGSGGYIYMNSRNQYEVNEFDFDSRIYANGGKGYNKGYGGAGGIIYFGDKIGDGIYNAFTDGGVGGAAYLGERKECATGSHGTIYWQLHDLLYLNNEINESSRKTQIEARVRNPVEFPNQHMVAEYLIVGEDS
jgi:hypothetical protein